MKAKDLAYEIGITRQELRHELQGMNFGVDPTAREIPDGIAQGIIRMLAPKYKKKKEELNRKEEAKARAAAIEAGEDPDRAVELLKMKREGKLVEEEKVEVKQVVKEEVTDSSDETEKEPAAAPKGPRSFRASQLAEEKRKDFAVQKAEEEKQAAERKKREAEARKELEKEMGQKPAAGGKKRGGKFINVTRKIEVEHGERGSRRKKKAHHNEHEHKAQKRFRAADLEEDLSPEERMAIIAEEEMRKKLEDEAFKASQAKRATKAKNRQKLEEEMVKKEGVIEIPDTISVKEFSDKTGVGTGKLVATLLKNGIMATMNTEVDFETWMLLAEELEVQLKREDVQHSVEDILEGDLAKLMEDEAENLSERPPVIVVMGHVDHGKTSILDFYRGANVVDGEAGGITQHVAAYQVEKRNKKITFLDTPGHEAFTSMRARGAKITDIAILVVAADESIKEQTVEAINHAKEAGVPIIVAINKMDKEGANPEKVKGDLMTHDLVPEDYGGDVMMVPVSAKAGTGMDDLLDAILLQSEVLEVKANANRNAIATVVESNLDKAMGPVATMVVNTGTLKVGDPVLVGTTFGKVRTMIDAQGKRMKEVGPSGAVQITGFDEVPQAGEILQVVDSEKEAKDKAEQVAELRGVGRGQGMGMSEILARIQSGKMNLLKVVLKADTQGSIEAIKQSFAKIDNEEVGVKVIHSAVGGVTESDVMMAAASQGIVVGFHVGMPPHVRTSAEKEGVEVQLYDIIYNLMDDIKQILTGMLQAEEIEVEAGQAEVKAVFMTTKKKQIVGAKVTNGVLVNGGDIKVLRKGEEIHKTKISNLKSFDKNVQEIKAVNECGIQFPEQFEYEEGDVLVCTRMEQKMKTL